MPCINCVIVETTYTKIGQRVTDVLGLTSRALLPQSLVAAQDKPIRNIWWNPTFLITITLHDLGSFNSFSPVEVFLHRFVCRIPSLLDFVLTHIFLHCLSDFRVILLS